MNDKLRNKLITLVAKFRNRVTSIRALFPGDMAAERVEVCADELEAALLADPQPQLTVEPPKGWRSGLTWAEETMQIINKLTPDIKGKAFDPDWFMLRQRLEEFDIARKAQPAAPTPSEPPIHIGYNDNVVPADEPHDPTDCPACEPAPTPQLGTCKWSDEPHVKDGTGYGCTDWKPVEAPLPAEPPK